MTAKIGSTDIGNALINSSFVIPAQTGIRNGLINKYRIQGLRFATPGMTD